MSEGAALFHLAASDEWSRAGRSGEYTGSTAGRTLAEEGFVHCCRAAQVQAVADRYFRGRDDVVLLRIDPARLRAEVRDEPGGAGDELFPHVYGPVPLEAVTRADPVRADLDGHLLLGDLIS